MTTLPESELIRHISRDNLWETNRQIATWVRLSGSPAEREAVKYLQSVLEEYGLRTTVLEHPALISYPLEASLEVIDESGAVLASYRCISHAYSTSVERLEATLVDMGNGSAADYAARDARGQIVLVNGLAGPVPVYQAEQAGAFGAIFVNDDHLHNMIVSTIWGTPTPESAARIPKTPAVSIVATDGADLRARLASGTVRVRMRTRVFMEWQTTPILIGELDGTRSRDFVLFSGHQDSWHEGAMDNGSANATMLEVARLLAQQREALYRGVRIAFWSGHSHGRYSGSTWYADHHWEDLYDRCVAHVNVDSTGARGATYYGSFPAHKELGKFGAEMIRLHTGQTAEARRMSRAGDMSFNGIGIPAMFMTLSQVPAVGDAEGSVAASLGAIVGGRMPWWWHTDGDTIDKVDLDVLELDTRVYISTLWRLCSQPILPMDFVPVVADIHADLEALQAAAGAHFDLGDVIARAAGLEVAVAQLARHASEARTDEEIAEMNRQMKALSRFLIPVTYTLAGQFEHDPAWTIPHLPGIQDARRLPSMPPDSDEYRFLQTKLVRARNALAHALRQASDVLVHVLFHTKRPSRAPRRGARRAGTDSTRRRTTRRR